MSTIPSPTDIEILNLLRCEPPTMAFNFFEYGGLTRSVFSLLQDVGDLEKIISENSGAVIQIPSSSRGDKKQHTLCYESRDSSLFVVANTHNNFSDRSDGKFLSLTKIQDTSGKKYQATFLALEVYREKGDAHPIWELGIYITENGSKDIKYGEEIIVEIPSTTNRRELTSRFFQFVSSLRERELSPALSGIVNNSQELQYFKSIIQNTPDIGVVSQESFEKERARWFRYLTGTLDVQKVLKFEDKHGYKEGYRVYRVELVSTHLESDSESGYHVQVLANSEGFPQADKHPRDPNERVIKFGPYSNHREALTRFLETGNHYLRHIHINAGVIKCPFTINRNFSQNDFKYATVVKDSLDAPITLSSWETSYVDHKKLPLGQIHHYLQLWNNSQNTLRLDEGVDFKRGCHPRTFMGKLLEIIPKVDYGDGSSFLEEARKQRILTKPST